MTAENQACRIGRVQLKHGAKLIPLRGLWPANVEPLEIVTKLDVAPERVLAAAVEAGLKQIVIVGLDHQGEFYFAANQSDSAATLWLLELAKHKLLRIMNGEV